MMGRTRSASLVLGLVLAAILGFLAIRLAHPRQPLVIPKQLDFIGEHRINPEDPSAHDRARDLWQQGLAEFRSASSDSDAFARASPLLSEIWTNWPDSDYGVRVQLFVIQALSTRYPYGVNPSKAADLTVDFIDRALKFPRTYFSERFQASSQAVAATAVRQLAKGGRASDAWEYCVRLRWSASRLDILAPACREVIDRYPSEKHAASRTLNALPRTIPLHVLDPTGIDRAGEAMIRKYLANPYDGEHLAEVILMLWKTPNRAVALSLKSELLQLEPSLVSRVEMAIAADRK